MKTLKFKGHLFEIKEVNVNLCYDCYFFEDNDLHLPCPKKPSCYGGSGKPFIYIKK
jgi:hypothetical protein